MRLFALAVPLFNQLVPAADHGLDGLEAVSFQSVVHVNIGLASRFVAFAFEDEIRGGGTGFVVHFLDFVVRLECLDGGFEASARLQEEPGGDEPMVCPDAGDGHLFGDRGHRVP